MKKFVPLFFLFLLLAATGNLLPLGKKEKKQTKPQYSELQKIEASGRVRLVGNSPMTSLVITGEDRDWYIESGENEKLMHLQQQDVIVIANEYYEDRIFANGTSAGRFYFLKDIVVVDPKP